MALCIVRAAFGSSRIVGVQSSAVVVRHMGWSDDRIDLLFVHVCNAFFQRSMLFTTLALRAWWL